MDRHPNPRAFCSDLSDLEIETLRTIPLDYDPFATAVEGMWFDRRLAFDRVIPFFATCLTHTKGGQSLEPFILERWQEAILANLFGWKQADGFRRYREAFVYVPRKNGKTTMSAGIVLWVLFCDGEFGAECYSAAAEREQAALVYSHAKQMVLNNPTLHAQCAIHKTTRAIVIEATNSSYKAVSADADTKHGFNAHLSIIDELHAQKNRDLVDVLETSVGSRDQPLTIHITTADIDRPESICNEKLHHAKQVASGDWMDPSMLPVVYEADRKVDDWKDRAVWKRVNPNYGVSVKEEYLERQFQTAMTTPGFVNTFKRLHLNMMTTTKDSWLDMEDWHACGKDEFDLESLRGRVCYGGLDLASVADIAAFVLVFPFSHHVRMLGTYWVPHETALRRKERTQYLAWGEKKHVLIGQDRTINFGVVRDTIVGMSKRYKIKDIGVDRHDGEYMMQELDNAGLHIFEFRQGFLSMSPPAKHLERLVIEGQLHHNNDPVMRWMASNAVPVYDTAKNVKLSKKHSSDKIDGMVALVMAIGRMLANASKKKSVYETRGMLRAGG